MKKGHVPEGEFLVELGEADVKRRGGDVTLITWSGMVPKSMAAAEALAAQGIDVEVIDLRSLVPLDKGTILASAGRTRRVVIVQEAVRRGGVASDIAAMIQEEAFDCLDGPIRIVAGRNTPIPFNLRLEAASVPQEDEIVEAVKRVCENSVKEK
jgi:pyruvate dehydrogenase E1 component beta subunit